MSRPRTRVSSGLLSMGLLIVALGYGAVSSAQPASGPVIPAGAPLPPGVVQGAPGDLESSLKEARAVVAQARKAVANVQQKLKQAQKARDVVKRLCLADNLKQLQVATRASRERLAALESAISSGQRERGRHELTVLGALGERTRAIFTHASECVGEEAVLSGRGTLAVHISPTVPNTDPSSTILNPFGNAMALAAYGPDSISPPPVVATPID